MTFSQLTTTSLLTLSCAFLLWGSTGSTASAAPGDTTWVQTFTDGWPVEPGWNSPRKGTFLFPSGERRWEKILMYYTLKCDPSQSPACGEWDYLTYTRLHVPTGRVDSLGNPIRERFELGRFITPYGINLDLGNGWTWVYDVSDFAPLLKDSVLLTAGNFQELLDMKFAFIEGIPSRDVLEIRNAWNGDFALKDFATKVPMKTVTVSESTKMVRLRTCVTGHQFDNATNCAEFCPKIHSVDVNGQRRFTWQIIQECSNNPLYPQGGTWIFDRAGWCPGMPAAQQLLELTPFIQGSTFTMDYNSDTDEFGNYVMESQIVSYGPPNFQNNAALEEILSPSDEKLMNRSNPVCGKPVIRIRNNGALPLTALDIRYGVRGGQFTNYHWTGNLGFLESQIVTLPPLDLTSPASLVFEVTLSKPNGVDDEYTANDYRDVSFSTVPTFNKTLIIYLRTNNAAHENRYEIRDAQNNLVRAKGGFQNNTFYTDSLFLADGCYEFVFFDNGDDGLSFFANNDGAGSLRMRIAGGPNARVFNPDYGKEIRYPFNIARPSGLDIPVQSTDFMISPQPAHDAMTMHFSLVESGEVTWMLHDLSGKSLATETLGRLGAGKHQTSVNLRGIPSGIHIVSVLVNGHVQEMLRIRVGR